jgi:hypothetical protein
MGMGFAGRRCFFSLGILVCGLALGSCSGRREAAENRHKPIPADLRVVFGEGGGFVGTWRGFTIEADGSLWRWSGPVAEAAAERVGMLSKHEMRAVWNWIEEASFFEAEGGEPSNLTAVIRVRANDREHRVTWSPGVEAVEPPLSETDALYRKLGHLASQIDK